MAVIDAVDYIAWLPDICRNYHTRCVVRMQRNDIWTLCLKNVHIFIFFNNSAKTRKPIDFLVISGMGNSWENSTRGRWKCRTWNWPFNRGVKMGDVMRHSKNSQYRQRRTCISRQRVYHTRLEFLCAVSYYDVTRTRRHSSWIESRLRIETWRWFWHGTSLTTVGRRRQQPDDQAIRCEVWPVEVLDEGPAPVPCL